MPYSCVNDATDPAVMIITNLSDGETIGLCGPCLGPWCAAMAEALTPATETAPELEPADDAGTVDSDVAAPEPVEAEVSWRGLGVVDSDEQDDEPGFGQSTVARAPSDPTWISEAGAPRP